MSAWENIRLWWREREPCTLSHTPLPTLFVLEMDEEAAVAKREAAKLAMRAKVPMVPIALKTDAWGNGKWLKDIGRIDATKRVHFEFGRPLVIEGRGTVQQKEATDFIHEKLSHWSGESDCSLAD